MLMKTSAQETSYNKILSGKHRVVSHIYSMTSIREKPNWKKYCSMTKLEQLVPVGSVIIYVFFLFFVLFHIPQTFLSESYMLLVLYKWSSFVNAWKRR